MLDRIQEIDTEAIEELTRIRRDQEVLDGRLQLMQERREGVSQVVFERVRGDYRRRLDELEEEARPLKQRARVEFAKLMALLRDVQQGRDEARLAKEELEFRHALGEFPDEQFEQESAARADTVDRRESELAEVEALRERFFAAVRAQDELEAPPLASAAEGPPGVPAPPVPLAEVTAAQPGATSAPSTTAGAEAGGDVPRSFQGAGGEADATADRSDLHLDEAGAAVGEPRTRVAPLQPGAGPPPPPPPMPGLVTEPVAEPVAVTGPIVAMPAAGDDNDRTHWDPSSGMPAPVAAAIRAAAEEDLHEAPTGAHATLSPPSAAPSAAGEELSGATRILARPRLVEMENGASGREHALALGRTSIGRASDNVVHLLDEAVSRHHAEVVRGEKGYTVRDLGSENGIYVNGERLPERALSEGDVIQIGARTLVYRGT